MSKNYKQVIVGDYVATPIKNAFNSKTAYWLSKKNYTKAIYMFTAENCISQKDLEKRLTDSGLKEYIQILEHMFTDPEISKSM